MDEYIKREAAFDAVFGQFCASSDETEQALNAAIEEIKMIPAADVVPVVRGKWVWDDGEDMHYYCSCCHHNAYGCTCEIIDGEYNYCPNCGAKMDKDGDGE